MPSIFEDRFGYVVAVPGASVTKALLRIDAKGTGGLKDNDTIFVNGLQLQHGVNSNVSYTLDNHIVISSAGDRIGSMNISGMLFDASCSQGPNRTLSENTGLKALFDFYESNRMIGGISKVNIKKIDVYFGYNGKKHTGYVIGMQTDTNNNVNNAMSFTLNCMLKPPSS